MILSDLRCYRAPARSTAAITIRAGARPLDGGGYHSGGRLTRDSRNRRLTREYPRGARERPKGSKASKSRMHGAALKAYSQFREIDIYMLESNLVLDFGIQAEIRK